MKNKGLIYTVWTMALAFGLNFFWLNAAQAVCPLCVVAVGGGLEISRWLGIDDIVTALWIGALTVSLALWTIDWLERKNILFFAKKTIVFLTYYFLIVASLYYLNIFENSFDKILGVNKIILGIIIGSVVFWGVSQYQVYLKKKNNNKVFFKFQKVVIPVSALIILSIIFYYITLPR